MVALSSCQIYEILHLALISCNTSPERKFKKRKTLKKAKVALPEKGEDGTAVLDTLIQEYWVRCVWNEKENTFQKLSLGEFRAGY